jgi:holliday junction DNA helicase RuvB
MARELGVGFRMTSGPVLAKAGDLAAILTNLEPRDVLFIDEIHRLSPVVEEVLYPAMEDFALDLVIGEGPAARTVRIDLPPFTLVGATTRLGLLTTPCATVSASRPGCNSTPIEELDLIVARGARLLGVPADPEGTREIARRARGTPRIAGRLLRRVVDFALVEGDGRLTRAMADRALTRLGVDHLGLDGADRRYLTLLADHYGGGPVGVETIAAALSESRDAIEEVIEPYLLQQGLIQRTPRGRMLGAKAWRHLGLAAPRGPGQSDLFDG